MALYGDFITKGQRNATTLLRVLSTRIGSGLASQQAKVPAFFVARPHPHHPAVHLPGSLPVVIHSTAFVDRRRCLISLPSRPLPISSLRPPAKREEECSVGLISHLISLRRTRPNQPLFIVHTAFPANQPFRPHFRGSGHCSSLSSPNCRCSLSTGPPFLTAISTHTLLRPRPKRVEAGSPQPTHTPLSAYAALPGGNTEKF
jgi:hypothetical protein